MEASLGSTFVICGDVWRPMIFRLSFVTLSERCAVRSLPVRFTPKFLSTVPACIDSRHLNLYLFNNTAELTSKYVETKSALGPFI